MSGATQFFSSHYSLFFQALIDVERRQMNEENPLDFAQHSATAKEIRDASVESSKKLNEFSVEMSMNKGIFDNVVHFKEKFGLDNLTAEQKLSLIHI